jgi:hypothetical protein
MKLTGEKLQTALIAQLEVVTLVRANGTVSTGISPRLAASVISGAAFTGYTKNGVVSKIIADAAAPRGPFATRYDVAAVMAAFPRIPHAQKNPQAPGAVAWVRQVSSTRTGHAGKVSTVHFG